MRDTLLSFSSQCFWYGVQLWFLWLCLAIVVDSLGKVSQSIESNRDLIIGVARTLWQLPLSLGLLLFVVTLYMD
ncbi:hypothetical protein LJY18_08415 [Pseudomonas sp. MMS21-TM103]|uniref:hypothetical protein n=1 Tax=Pseudomonas sp. MMS21 TM103 TaxID=2886506 RepID=UPI001EDEAA91|nr:hypothetical protein [Pseudomonas sp. MMS21 TM103]MCG4453329.1 hypothetical protein [Pseudomonas sp. MMS21 TM103]